MLILNSTEFKQFDSTSNYQFSNYCKLNFTVTLLTDEQQMLKVQKWHYFDKLFDKYMAYKKFSILEQYNFFINHFSLTFDHNYVLKLVNQIVYYTNPTIPQEKLRYQEILLMQTKHSSFTHLADFYVTYGKLPDRLQNVFNEMILELM